MKIFSSLRRFAFPTQKEINISEAKTLVLSLVKRFSIEEQTEIIIQAKQELVKYRTTEIEDTIKHLERLKSDLEVLKKPC